MKKTRLLALLLALVLVLAACAKGEETHNQAVSKEGEEATIVFWHAMNGRQEEALTKLTQDFMAANPHVKVDLQNQTGYGELQQKITATSASPKDLPTLTQAYPDWMFNPIKDGLVHDLTAYTKGLEDYEDILEGFRKGTNIDGKVYSMPFNKSTEVLFYNSEALAELGKEVPTNPEELVDVAKAYTEATGNAALGFDSLSNYFTTYITNKGEVYGPDFDAAGQVALEAVNFHLDGIKEGYMRLAGTGEYFSTLLGNEEVLMYIGSNAGETYVKEAAAGRFTPKAVRSPFATTIQQGTDIFVFESASDAQKQAAYEYLTFLTSKESQIYWGIETGYVPARVSALESDEYKNADSMIAPILKEATSSLYTNPVVQGASQAYREARTVMEAILADPANANVEATLENFKTTLEGYWSGQ